MAVTLTTNLKLKKQDLADTGWHTALNDSFDLLDSMLSLRGAGSPVGVVTPSFISQLYLDTTDSKVYCSTGVTNSDWFEVNPTIDSTGNMLTNAGYEIAQRTTTPETPTLGTVGVPHYFLDRWFVRSEGAAVQQNRTLGAGPVDTKTRYSHVVTGASSVTTVDIGQRMEASEMPHLTAGGFAISLRLFNNTGVDFVPTFEFATADASNNFGATTHVATVSPGINCVNGDWTSVFATVSAAAVRAWANITNGLEVVLRVPSGKLLAADTIRIVEFQLLEGTTVLPYAPRKVSEDWVDCLRFYETGRIFFTEFIKTAGSTTYNLGHYSYRYMTPKLEIPTTASGTLVVTIDSSGFFNTTNLTDSSNYNHSDLNGFIAPMVSTVVGVDFNGFVIATVVVDVEL